MLGLPADPGWGMHLLQELRCEDKLVPIEGIGCVPAVIQATREEMLERIGRACARGDLRFPEKNGPVTWPAFEMKEALTLAA